MGNEIERLSIGVGADTAALGSGFASVGGLVGKLGGMLGSVGGMIAASIGAAAIAIGTFAVKAAKDIEAGTNKIRTGTGATGKALDDLAGNMKNVGKKVPQSFEEIGGAIADLNTRLGLTGKPLEKMTEQMINLGKITGEDVPGLIRETTRTFGDWNIAAKDQSASLDYLYKVSQSTGIGVSALSEKLTKAGVPLRQLGYDFETSAALVGKWEKEGVNLDMLLASLNRSAVNLAKDGVPDMNAAWEEMTGRIKGAKSDTEAMTIATEYFGAKAASNMAGGIREGRLEIGSLKQTLTDSTETINKAAGDTRTLGERMSILGNNAKVVAAPLGKGLLVAAEYAVKGITAAVQWISEFIEKLQTGSGAFKTAREVIIYVFTGIRDVIKGVVTVVTAIWNRFGKQIVAQVKTNFMFVWRIIKAVFKVIQGIFNVFKGIFTGDWKTFWNGIKAIFGGVWDAIKAVFSAVWNTIKNIAQAVWNAITGIAKLIWDGIKLYFTVWLATVKAIFSAIWNGIKGALELVWNVIKTVATTIWDILKGYFTIWLDTVKGAFALVWGIIKGALELVWNTIKSVATTVWDGIKTVIWTPIKWVGDNIVTAWNTIRDTVVGIWNGIKDSAVTIWQTVAGAVSRVWDGISGAWSSVWNGIISVIKGIVNGFVDGINVVLGGIRGVAKFIPGVEGPSNIPKWKDMGGPILGSGRVLLNAEPGEYMMRKRAVQKYGSGFMGAVNAGTYQPGSGGASVTFGDIYLNAVSPDYDANRLVKLTIDGIARRGGHTGRVMRRGR